jgi:creatinine amidohydrolase
MPELADMAWPDVAERAGRSILAVPLGSTEQHGPHLPLSTDSDIALELSRRLAGELPDVVVAPPVHYGASGEHAGFPGTLSIGQEALEMMLVELCRSADAFAGVIIVSTHGGNREAVDRAAALLRSEGRKVVPWYPSASDPTDSHAGRTETSCQLRIQPQLVRQERFRPGDRTPLAELMPELRRAGVAAASPSGILGDPTGSTAEDGERFLSRWTADLVTTAREQWTLAAAPAGGAASETADA